MKISRVYSNKPNIFSAIDFNCGDNDALLSVIFGDVTDVKDKNRDSHNLGKTTLLHLIDFMLLKGSDTNHFLYKHKEQFSDFVFFIEIILDEGGCATARRSVADPNAIALIKHQGRFADFSSSFKDDFDHWDLSLTDAVRLLDSWLGLQILSPYSYRKAITYFLRAQGDYADELQLQKFRVGKDRDWKPFVAHLFGFKEEIVRNKYLIDDEIDKQKIVVEERQALVQFTESDLPELAARINSLRQNSEEVEARIDAFEFDTEEKRLISELVEKIETEISEMNSKSYSVRYDIQQIRSALGHKDKFDLSQVREIFQEAEITFPDQLRKSYEELVAFNKKITTERDRALRSRLRELEDVAENMRMRKIELDQQRSHHLRVVQTTDTFEKFKELQKSLSKQKAEIVYLEGQREKLLLVSEAAKVLRQKERYRGEIIDDLKTMVEGSSSIYENFQNTFSSFCQRVLNHEGIFFVKLNSNHNFDYDLSLGLAGKQGQRSSQSEGTSYKKLVCALFDLAMLKVYHDKPFFHFVYHDGIMEGLDNRKKLAFLELVREVVSTANIQYILTLIRTDLPRDVNDTPIQFLADEIVLQLHDGGDEGRLFRMSEF